MRQLDNAMADLVLAGYKAGRMSRDAARLRLIDCGVSMALVDHALADAETDRTGFYTALGRQMQRQPSGRDHT